MKPAVLVIAAVIAMGPALPALGDDAQHENATKVAQATAPLALAEGEVRKVDMDAKKITIKHGPIANLDMPPMTMVFQVKDPAMLEQVKAGDKVRFSADKTGGAYTVTSIEAVR